MTAALSNPSAMEAAIEAAFRARGASSEAQAAAFDRFAARRFPNRRVEGWKWSDMNAVLRNLEPVEARAPEIAPSPFASLDPLEFRIIGDDIQLLEETRPEGIRYGRMDAVGTIPELENHPMAALNVAMTRKALGMEIFEGVDFKRPILIRHINTGAGFTFAQTMVRVSPGARAHLIETYEGEGAGLYSHLLHMVVRDGADFRRTVLHDAGKDLVTHAVCAAKIDGDARFAQTSLSTGGKLCRHETHVHFWAPGSRAEINSAALLSGEAHSDVTTVSRHISGGCEARQLHKGVVRDRGSNVFQGKFQVLRDAQKTDAKMTANALLLSDGAEANHKPELEIYADDVECAHGSTVGALDENALFYLRQRGLDEAAARALLVEAFVGDVIEDVPDEAVKDILAAKVAAWMGAVT